MILYTLLTTHKDKDLTNVVLTSTLIYYLAYSSLPVERNYIIIAAVILVDLYFTSNADARRISKRNGQKHGGGRGVGPSLSQRKHHRHGHERGLASQLKRQLDRPHRVRFAPNNTMHSYNPELPPRIMPQIQPPRATSGFNLPQTTNPMYNQYLMQHQMTRGQHQPIQLNSQYHQPGMTPYHQSPESQPKAPPMIDNRHLVPVDDDSSSSGSSVSIDSETISMSSEEY